MTSQNLQPSHWRYTELDDRNFQVQGQTLFYVVVLFATVLLVTLLFHYARWVCRHHSPPPETSHGAANAPLPRPSLGLDAAAIDRLPIVLHGGAPSEVEEAGECSICLGEFEDGEKVKVLPQCGHRYHCGCVDQWLATRSVCPLCRAPLPVDSAGP
ncbi:RING-H2 finger protein ATL66 [Syzygium oleosum]|uniref:RING-H2 finger protein ATL66 n=1 Tax=Syzygium oleosum TaxID=219896 RepID=UPI0011D221B0|nr:RING-H2 finger protein ATL66 [Syzygium oleosum]